MFNIEIKIWIALGIIVLLVPIVYAVYKNFSFIIGFFKNLYGKIEYKKNLEKIKQEILTRKPKKPKTKLQLNASISQSQPPKNKEIVALKMEKYKYMALSYKEKGDLETYEQKLIEGLALEPENLEFTKLLGDLYFNLGMHKKSLPLLKRILEKEPEDHKSIWQIGQVYFEKGDYDNARLLTEKAVKLNSENPKYYMSLADIMYNMDEISEAITNMEQALKLRPNNINYLLGIATLLEECERFEDAKRYYYKVLEIDQTNRLAKEKLSNM